MNVFAARLAQGGAVLAPMAGFSDAPFRRLAREHGSAWAVTEMVSARALAKGDERSLAIPAPYPGEPDVVIQLFAADPDEAAAAARLLQDRFAPAAFDLNMGCPVKKILDKGCGARLIGDPEGAARIVTAIRDATGLPVSAKTRLGRDRVELDEVARALVEGGVAALAVHGRTAAAKYGGAADPAPILDVAAWSPVPVLYSGDVDDPAAAHALQAQGVGVMIARGALGRPWIFDEVRGGAPRGWREAAAVLLRHVDLQVTHDGEARGLRGLRAHLATYAERHPEARGLRDALVRVDTRADVHAALATTPGGAAAVAAHASVAAHEAVPAHGATAPTAPSPATDADPGAGSSAVPAAAGRG